MSYPKIMRAGPWQQVVVANEEQERALPAEYGGLAGEVETYTTYTYPEVEPQSKEELQALCDKKGIEYDKRWGIAKLLEALA